MELHGEVKGRMQKTGDLNVVMTGMDINMANFPAPGGDSADGAAGPAVNGVANGETCHYSFRKMHALEAI